MDIKRTLYHRLLETLGQNYVTVLYGPRRVGKTFLLERLAKEIAETKKTLFLKGDQYVVQQNLSTSNPVAVREFIGRDTEVLILDEAQYIPHIGQNLKVLVDEYKDLKIIASGSASFDLAQKVGEPLTGRKKTFHLFPVSARELIETQSRQWYEQLFEDHLILGGYPHLFSFENTKEKQEYLIELTDTYLFRDILEFESIKNAKKLRDMLVLIAYQIGKEVSLSELGNHLDLHKDTVFRYLELLEKSFILINIRGFSRNLRKEISKTSRWYFYDNGIRNALINNFNSLNLRNDVGQLWENYLVIERLKKQNYFSFHANNYFWRTYDKKEIDFVEEREGKLYGYEFKWNSKKAGKAPYEWLATYPQAEFQTITKNNYLEFIL